MDNIAENTDKRVDKAKFIRYTFGFLILIVLTGVIGLLSMGKIKNPFIRSKNSSQIKLQEGFPQSPVYPESTIKDSTKNLEGAEEDYRYSGTWETSDPVPAVMKWYLEKLKTEGWNMNVLPADGESTDIQFAQGYKGNDETNIIQVSVMKDTESGKTKIVVEFPSKSAIYEDEEGEE